MADRMLQPDMQTQGYKYNNNFDKVWYLNNYVGTSLGLGSGSTGAIEKQSEGLKERRQDEGAMVGTIHSTRVLLNRSLSPLEEPT